LGGYNTFAYGMGNPVVGADPHGKFVVSMLVGIGLWVAFDIIIPSFEDPPPFDSGVVYRAGFPLDLSVVFEGGKIAGGVTRACGRKLAREGANYADDAPRLVIGKMKDLGKEAGWKPGDYMLILNKNSTWDDNLRLLKDAMKSGRPIKDVSPTQNTGFLFKEHEYLYGSGWRQITKDGETFWIQPN